MKTIIEVSDSSVDEMEPKQWIDVEGDPHNPKSYETPEVIQGLSTAFCNGEVNCPITMTVKQMTDEQYNNAEAVE